jgi:hypothetical protein
MKPYMTRILGSGVLGAKTLAQLSVAWAPNTVATYGNTIRRYFDFFEEHQLAPLAATPANMARYVAWLGPSRPRAYNLTCWRSTASSRTTGSKQLPSAT